MAFTQGDSFCSLERHRQDRSEEGGHLWSEKGGHLCVGTAWLAMGAGLTSAWCERQSQGLLPANTNVRQGGGQPEGTQVEQQKQILIFLCAPQGCRKGVWELFPAHSWARKCWHPLAVTMPTLIQCCPNFTLVSCCTLPPLAPLH